MRYLLDFLSSKIIGGPQTRRLLPLSHRPGGRELEMAEDGLILN